jgi:Flp pilus assembly protein TadD
MHKPFKQVMASGYKSFRCIRFLGAAFLVVLVGACASAPVGTPTIPPLKNQSWHAIESVDLLRMTPEMRAFVEQFGADTIDSDSRAWSLTYAALDPFLLAFDYDPMVTVPADEAFGKRRGNCLSFSSMFIAMARDAGLKAWYQEVKIAPKWSNVNDIMLVNKHVNAVILERGKRYTVDVSRRARKAFEVSRRLSDQEAQAQYYSNLGADALIAGDLSQAYAYFRKALETDSQNAYLWSNLGVVLKRNEQIEDALLAYHTALKIDPDQSVALNNLYTYYDEIGDTESAERIRSRVEHNRRKNPYYLHYMAEIAIEENRYADATELLKRAINIDGEEYRFYYTLAQSQYQEGQIQLALDSLQRARELAPAGTEIAPLEAPDGS